MNLIQARIRAEITIGIDRPGRAECRIFGGFDNGAAPGRAALLIPQHFQHIQIGCRGMREILVRQKIGPLPGDAGKYKPEIIH